jgi:hypothetical protein
VNRIAKDFLRRGGANSRLTKAMGGQAMTGQSSITSEAVA